jgi:hypothetical protein
MKTDRELLELAAKAVGYRIRFSERGSCDFDNGDYWISWNPLTNDGDALRLAVKLRFEIFINHTEIDVRTPNGWSVIVSSDDEDDPYAATRRAIVCAAAAIVKSTAPFPTLAEIRQFTGDDAEIGETE